MTSPSFFDNNPHNSCCPASQALLATSAKLRLDRREFSKQDISASRRPAFKKSEMARVFDSFSSNCAGFPFSEGQKAKGAPKQVEDQEKEGKKEPRCRCAATCGMCDWRAQQ
jgi:hypothetical protein